STGAGVRDVEWPVPGAVVVVVEDVTRGVINPRIGNPRVIVQDVRVLAGAGALAPVRDDHRRRGRTAPGLTTAVVLGVLTRVDLLRVLGHGQDQILRHARHAGQVRLGVHRVGRHRADPRDRRRASRGGRGVGGGPRLV